MLRTRRSVLLWALLLLAAGPCAAKTLVVVLLPGTSLSDWQRADAPNLHEVLATGALAVMNTRTARLPSDRVRETPESAVLTLGAGARAAGGPEATDFQRVDLAAPGVGVTAGALWTRRMGRRAPPGSRVNTQWPRLLRENAGRDYDIHLGNLAVALRRAGVTVKAIGGPLADALAADDAGMIGPPTPHPGGVDAGERCLIWDAGSDVAGADRSLGALLARLGDGRVIVLSPCASDAAYARGERLCPIVVWGVDVVPGLISSSSTRRAGLVADTDFAVTVGDYFGIGVQGFPARPFGASAWKFHRAEQSIDQVAALDAGAVRQWRGMHALPFLAVLLGLWMLAWTALATFRRLPAWAGLVPAVVILALLVSVSDLSFALWTVGLALLIVAAWRLNPERLSFGLTAAFVGVAAADMLLGDPLMRSGLLGYSAIEGARYYGIGNEAMGALVGACLVTADRLWPRLPARRRHGLWAGLGLVTVLLGSPAAGAKAGGLVVALAAFGGYGWLRSGRHGNWRVAALAGMGIVAALLLVALLDSRLAIGRQSHFGQAVARLQAGGAREWGDIVVRKLAVEGRLLYHSAWACPVWGGLASLWWLTRQRVKDDQPLVGAGLLAVAACLLVNDAGTVAAALCLSLLWGWVAVRHTQKSPGPAEVVTTSA